MNMQPMKKLTFHLLLAMILSGCALPGGLLSPPAAPTASGPTSTAEPSATASLTPTVPTPTYTPTPTLLGGPPATKTPLATATQVETETPTPGPEESETPEGTPTFVQLVQGGVPGGFVSVLLSSPSVYWGEKTGEPECPNSSVAVVVQAGQSSRVDKVSIFLRFKSKQSGVTSAWSSGYVMENRGGGTFAYTIEPEKISGYDYYPDAWIQMQFVSTNAAFAILDRSPVYGETLGVKACR